MARDNNCTEVFIRNVFFLFQPKHVKKTAVAFQNYFQTTGSLAMLITMLSGSA